MNRIAESTYIATMPSSTSDKIEIKIHGEDWEMNYTPDDFQYRYSQYILRPIKPFFSQIINSLLKKYKFLGYQMNHILGNISDEDYKNIENNFFETEIEDNDIQSLKGKIKNLFFLTNSVYTSDQLSLIFDCSIENAEKAIDTYLLEK